MTIQEAKAYVENLKAQLPDGVEDPTLEVLLAIINAVEGA